MLVKPGILRYLRSSFFAVKIQRRTLIYTNELISFGRWIFVSTAMTFLATQSDRLILSKFFSFSTLGVYTIAFNFAQLPKTIIGKLNAQIIFPIFAKKMNSPRPQLLKKFLAKRKLLLAFCSTLVILVVCFGDFVIETLYTEEYIDAAWILPLLAIGLWPLILNESINKFLFAINRPQYNALGTFLKFLYMIGILPLVFIYKGIFR